MGKPVLHFKHHARPLTQCGQRLAQKNATMRCAWEAAAETVLIRDAAPGPLPPDRGERVLGVRVSVAFDLLTVHAGKVMHQEQITVQEIAIRTDMDRVRFRRGKLPAFLRDIFRHIQAALKRMFKKPETIEKIGAVLAAVPEDTVPTS